MTATADCNAPDWLMSHYIVPCEKIAPLVMQHFVKILSPLVLARCPFAQCFCIFKVAENTAVVNYYFYCLIRFHCLIVWLVYSLQSMEVC